MSGIIPLCNFGKKNKAPYETNYDSVGYRFYPICTALFGLPKVIKYWKSGDVTTFDVSFDDDGSGGVSYPFDLALKYPNQSGYGATAGANGSWDIDPSKSGMLFRVRFI